MKKGPRSRLFFTLAIICLLIIGIVIVREGALRDNWLGKLQTFSPKVLGEKTSTVSMNAIKTQLSAKAMDMQKSLLLSIEKELSSLTQAQISAVKYQICRDWGVVDASPSASPEAN